MLAVLLTLSCFGLMRMPCCHEPVSIRNGIQSNNAMQSMYTAQQMDNVMQYLLQTPSCRAAAIRYAARYVRSRYRLGTP